MIEISDNFTDSKTLLRKEAKKRENEGSNPDEALENDAWLLFYKLGFDKLNIGRECEVKYGKKESDLLSKKVDVVAESNEVRVYVECTTQKVDTPKIKQWSSEVEDIRKYESGNPETDKKNVVFVYCNSSSISENDRDKLLKKGIVYLNSAILDYFLELKAQYSRLSYFQLISYLCKGQQIRSLSSDDLTIPTIRTKYGSKTYAYLFGIHPSTLIPLSTVPHRKLDYEDDLNQNYQRLVKKTKVNAIKRFIKDQRGIFPTNIIISIESDKHNFKPFGKSINDIQHGTLTLPRKYQSINVIDGQHRLFAYDGLEQAEKDLIYVVAFDKMDLEEQILTFININEKQTKVSPSLLWDLYPSILDPSENIKPRISLLVKQLNEDEESAWSGIIKYDSASYSKKQPKLTLESVCTALKTEKNC
jgi:DNA sulfur modification protein DndB